MVNAARILTNSLKADWSRQNRCETRAEIQIGSWFAYMWKNSSNNPWLNLFQSTSKLSTSYLNIKNNVMVFLVLFAVKTGHFLGTNSLSFHHFLIEKETGKKKQEAWLSWATGYLKTTLISWYVDWEQRCNDMSESSGRVVVRGLTSHQCGPGSISRLGVTCRLSLLVLFSALRGFPPGTPVFPCLLYTSDAADE